MKALPDYQTLLETSQSVNWRIEDIVGDGHRFDFGKPFLPETFARTEALPFLSGSEKLTLNHIRSRSYLALFELVETFVVPFVSDEAAEKPGDNPYRARALRQFAREETKHRELFRRALAEFDAAFGTACAVIGPADAIVESILTHDPLAVTVAILGLEWMSQDHYVQSIEDDESLDPQFKCLLKHHWIEEAQHAALDGLMLQEKGRDASPDTIARAVDGYFDIGGFLDGGFKGQTELDLDAFERACGRKLGEAERSAFLREQHQAYRWTFLGSAMRNENFLTHLGGLGGEARARVESASAAFC